MSADLTTSSSCLRGSGATACASEARHLRRQVTLVNSNVALRRASGTTRIQHGIRPRIRVGPTRIRPRSDSDGVRVRLGVRLGSARHRLPPAVPPA